MKILEKIKTFLLYCNFKTIYFNFHYFTILDALHFPVFLSRNTKLRCTKGNVKIIAPLRPGLVRIGTDETGLYDKKHNRPVWENMGTVIFHGLGNIKYGAKIIVGINATLEMGDNFRLSSGSSVICYKSIKFGYNCRISWDTQFIDTDFHRVFDSNHNHVNPDKEIILGNDCWIGNHCLIQKGTHLRNIIVVASNSMVNIDCPESNIILAGSPAKVLRTSITWDE
jgi:acetyltransferase-like isoleucine patch superfamily enzyme